MVRPSEQPGLLRVFLLGPPRFEFDGAPFRFKSARKTMSLLGYLLLNREGAVARDRIAFTLWPDDEEEAALGNLRRNLYLLTKSLPTAPAERPWLTIEASDVQWNPDAPLWLDAVEFERLAQEADPSSLEAAAALYSGDLLEEVYDDWVFAERERLRSLYLRTLGDLIAGRRKMRDFEGAIGFARRLLSVDSWREDVVRTVMSLRYESGDRAGALAEYDAFAARLKAELHVDPMPETTAVRERVAANADLPDDGEGTPVDSRVERLGRRPLPFVDREGEFEQLRAYWNRTTQRAGSLVLVGGEAGIGKSRLVDEFAFEVERDGARILHGATSAPEAAPYQCLTEAVRSALAFLTATKVDPIWLAVVAQVVPEIRARRPDLPVLPPLQADREQKRLQQAFVAVIEALARSRPTLIVLEDLHHAGDATLAAVEELARRITMTRVCLIGTYRDDETLRAHPLRKLRRRLSERGALNFLSPTRLPSYAIDELVQLVPELARAGPGVSAALQQRSEGNALFLSEAIRDLLEGGDGSGAGVRATISARLMRLDPEARTFADSAAVAGTTFDVELVRDLTGWSEDRALESLDKLLDRSIVREAGSSRNYAYEFSHHLVQDSLYEELPEDVRVRRHRRVARVLEERAEEGQSAAVAFHYERGRVPGLAARYYGYAAESALALGATEDALSYLERAVEMTDEPATRSSLLLLAERAHALRGDRKAQQHDLDALAALLPSVDDAEIECELLLRRVALARSTGRLEDERAVLDELWRKVEDPERAPWLIGAHVAEAARSFAAGRYDESRHHAGEAAALAAAAGKDVALLEAICTLAEIDANQGRIDEAQTRLNEAHRIASGLGARGALARATTVAGREALVRQDFTGARKLYDSALSLHRESGDRVAEADALTNLAYLESRFGRFDQSRAHLEASMQLHESTGDDRAFADALVSLAYNDMRSGRTASSEASMRRARAAYERIGDARGRMITDINLSFILLRSGDAHGSRAHAQAALEESRALGNPVQEAAALGQLGAAERDCGDLPTAVAHLERALSLRMGRDNSVDVLGDRLELALAYQRNGQIAEAMDLANSLAASEAETLTWPYYLPWVVGTILSESSTEGQRAQAFLKRAASELEAYASGMDGETRSDFLRLPLNRTILEAAAKAV